MEDLDILVNSLAELSIDSDRVNDNNKKIRAIDIIQNMTDSKLDRLIDIVVEFQKNNAKNGFNPLYHKTCNNILVMVINTKRSRAIKN